MPLPIVAAAARGAGSVATRGAGKAAGQAFAKSAGELRPNAALDEIFNAQSAPSPSTKVLNKSASELRPNSLLDEAFGVSQPSPAPVPTPNKPSPADLLKQAKADARRRKDENIANKAFDSAMNPPKTPAKVQPSADKDVNKQAGAQKKLADAMQRSTDNTNRSRESTDKASKKTESFSGRMKGLSDSYTKASVQAYLFKAQIEGIFGKIAGAATAGASALKSMADPLASLTKLSNPVAVQQLEIAFSDAMAVMGRVALPIVQAFTRAIRMVGDHYARLEPIITKVSLAVAASMDRIFGELEKVWKQSSPAINLMADAMLIAIQVGTQMATMFLRLVNVFLKVATSIAKFFGFESKGLKDRSSFGASVRNVRIGGSGEDVAKAAQEKAFAQALNLGPKADTEKDILAQIRDGLAEKLEKLYKTFAEFIKTVPTRDDIAAFLTSMVESFIAALPVPDREALERGASAIVGGPNAAIAALLQSAMTR